VQGVASSNLVAPTNFNADLEQTSLAVFIEALAVASQTLVALLWKLN
jgi:hypothetical protein